MFERIFADFDSKFCMLAVLTVAAVVIKNRGWFDICLNRVMALLERSKQQ
jgi:hypothetical protein